jgi:hypothetical protein
MENNLTLNMSGNELIIREGKAAEIFNPVKVDISGDIYAPGEFYAKRKKEVDALTKKTNVVVDIEGLSITLFVNESDHFFTKIHGKLSFFSDFLDFGINRNKKYSVSDLYKMLRLKRAYFQNRSDHAAILDQLKKFEAKTEVEFQSLNDFKGSTALKKIESCKTNLTYQFNLNIPIYKGHDSSVFPVEIEFEPTDGSIVCWLMSEDLAELEIKIRDEVMKTEVEKFKDFAVIKK